MIKLRYILLLHTKFVQAEKLIRRLVANEVSFVIHIDAKVQRGDVERFQSAIKDVPDVLYARRVDGRWGSYGQAEAIMSGIQCAASSPNKCDRCVLLSGQDYPIATQGEIEKFFTKNASIEYCEAYQLDITDKATPGWSPHYRFCCYHFWFRGRRHTVPFLRKSAPAEVLYHGSTWWALTGAAIAYISLEFERNKKLRDFLRTGFLVDEVYVPTLLMNSPFAHRVARMNVTFAEWTPTSGPHPRTLVLGDLHRLLASSKLFARKFDQQIEPELLNLLDAASVET
jgi:Core-2/I-Branching enzyme